MVAQIMIDMLVLRCNFQRIQNTNSQFIDMVWPDYDLGILGIPLEKSVDREGDVINVRHPWERIPSSFEGMAFKVFDHRYDPLDKFYIEIKASPAKIMQGHNIFGSSDIYDCCFHLLDLLYMTNPEVTERLDSKSWELAQIDLTYSTRAKDTHESNAFIRALQNVSYGQTKSRTGFGGTAYFGKKNSRLKKIKVYDKDSETKEIIKKNSLKPNGDLLNVVFTPELLDFTNGLIRWEVSLYHRYFERLGISTRLEDMFKETTFTEKNLEKYWIAGTKDLFEALEGQTMKTLDSNQIKEALRVKYSKISAKTGKVSYIAADSAYRTYNDIKRDGWLVVRDSMSTRTFDHHVKMLTDCGLSRAALQNMTGLNDGAQIVPFVRFIEVNFCKQFPDWYEQPAPFHVRPIEQRTHLRLVA